MKMNLITKLLLPISISLVAIMPLSAEVYAKGNQIQGFKAKDQHGEAFELKPKMIQYLLVSHDMETGKKANSYLTTLDKNYLINKKAVYLANIYGMPGIGRFFAIPKMKKYTHRIILGDDETLIAKFPEELGKVTVMEISGGTIQSIRFWDPNTTSLDQLLP